MPTNLARIEISTAELVASGCHQDIPGDSFSKPKKGAGGRFTSQLGTSNIAITHLQKPRLNDLAAIRLDHASKKLMFKTERTPTRAAARCWKPVHPPPAALPP
jgi:hypothetical protein